MSEIKKELDFVVSIKISADDQKSFNNAVSDIERYFNSNDNPTSKTSIGINGCFSWALTRKNARLLQQKTDN